MLSSFTTVTCWYLRTRPEMETKCQLTSKEEFAWLAFVIAGAIQNVHLLLYPTVSFNSTHWHVDIRCCYCRHVGAQIFVQTRNKMQLLATGVVGKQQHNTYHNYYNYYCISTLGCDGIIYLLLQYTELLVMSQHDCYTQAVGLSMMDGGLKAVNTVSSHQISCTGEREIAPSDTAVLQLSSWAFVRKMRVPISICDGRHKILS